MRWLREYELAATRAEERECSLRIGRMTTGHVREGVW